MRRRLRGTQIVHDGPVDPAIVPDPGGLPGAEPLTPFWTPALGVCYPYEKVSEAEPPTCDMHGRRLSEAERAQMFTTRDGVYMLRPDSALFNPSYVRGDFAGNPNPLMPPGVYR